MMLPFFSFHSHGKERAISGGGGGWEDERDDMIVWSLCVADIIACTPKLHHSVSPPSFYQTLFLFSLRTPSPFAVDRAIEIPF
jgi:hypothetical protein